MSFNIGRSVVFSTDGFYAPMPVGYHQGLTALRHTCAATRKKALTIDEILRGRREGCGIRLWTDGR
jgi:hypothetical protein